MSDMIFKDIPYIDDGDVRHRLDVILPGGLDKPVPTVIRIHGGGWWAYSKDDLHIAHRLVDAGFALVTINYRYSRQKTFPAQLEDCKAAVRWARAHGARYGLATQRLGVCGDSAGGHLACLLGVTGGMAELDVGENLDESSAVQAVMAWYPPTDIRKWPEHFRECGVPEEKAKGVLECAVALLGGPVAERRMEALLASPAALVRPGGPPFLLIHGKADDVVPYPQSLLLAENLREVKVPVEVCLVEGAGHGGALFETPEQTGLYVSFFRTHLDSKR